MPSDWYTVTGNPGEDSHGDSAPIRAEFALIETAMAKLPTLTGAGSAVVVINAGGTGMETIAQLTVSQGGTGVATVTDGAFLLGAGTGALTEFPVTTSGDVIVGDGSGAPTTITAFTSSTGYLRQEVGGIETDISAITTDNFLVGTSAGVIGVRTAAQARTHLALGALATLSTINNDYWSGTDLAVTNGGTGSSTAAAARTNLGVVIGSDVQAYDAGLQSISGLTTAADKMIYTTAADTYATASLTSFGRTLLADSSASAARSTLGLVIGTNVQAYDAGLNSIAGLVTAADTMIYTTALDTYSTTSITSFARTLISQSSASNARSTLAAMQNVITTRGDVVRGSSSGVAERLGLGTSGQVMGSDGTDMIWVDMIPAGTIMTFLQNSVPSGWTLNSSFNDRAIINTTTLATGGTTGGSWTISGISVSNHTLTTSELPASMGNFTMRRRGAGTSKDVILSASGMFSLSSGSSQDSIAQGSGSQLEHIVSLGGGGSGHNHSLSIGSAWRPSCVYSLACSKN